MARAMRKGRQGRVPRSQRRRPKLAVDLGALDRVVDGLRQRGFDRDADQLDEALHRTAYPSSTDMVLELTVALRASYRRARHQDSDLEKTFRKAARELRKVRADYDL